MAGLTKAANGLALVMIVFITGSRRRERRCILAPNFGEAIVFGPALKKHTRVGDDWSVLPGYARVEAIKTKLQMMADSLDPAAPWSHPQARAWDGITMAQWLAQNVKEQNIREFMVGDMSYA